MVEIPIETIQGRRVKVSSKKQKPLGYGTYLETRYVLLDKGTEIHDHDCVWEVKLREKQPPELHIQVLQPVRLFRLEGDRLVDSVTHGLKAGPAILAETKLVEWKKRKRVVGRIPVGDEMFWLILSEVKFPMEPV